MTRLNPIPVQFDQERHTYTNTETGDVYSGITGTLIRRLFPDKYKGIPRHILRRAAERGSNVHEDIELHETLGVEPSTEEGRNYVRLKEANGLKFLESEYTVSDLEHYATNIDAVYEAEDNIVELADYKTTSRLDKESVSWQLSVCAHFFEKNNPHVRVRRLLAVWLRGDIAQLIEVERHSDAEVRALIEADQRDAAFDYSPAFPDYIAKNEAALCAIGRRIRELTEEYDAIKSEILARMVENNDKTFDTGNVLITRVAPSLRETFDSKRFKAEHADIYGQYTTATTTKESLKLTIR